MNSLLPLLQAFIRPAPTDGALLFWAKEILGAFLILTLFWILAQLSVMFLNKWGRRLTAFTATDLDDRILERVIPHVSRLLTILGIYLAIRSLPLHEKLFVVLSGILFIILVVVLFNVIYNMFDEFLKWYISGQQEGDEAHLSRQMQPIVEKVVMLFMMGTALIVILKHFNYDIFSLVTALGVGSLAVGMAAKDTLAHMISGFTLMLDRPFRIGDRIQLANGQIGDVSDIGLRSTKIKTLDNQLLIIPNSDLCNTMVINHAFPDARVKGRINIGIVFGSDVDNVKALLLETALAVEGVLHDPPPDVYLVSIGDSGLNMSLFFWVAEYGSLFGVTDRLNISILHQLSEHNIAIPFPTRTVRLEQLQQT